MNIDDIKPPAGYGPSLNPPAEAPTAPKSESTFAAAKDKLQASDSAEPTSSVSGVAARFSRTALQDPTKLDVVVRALVSELIDSGQRVAGPLSATDKESLLDFISGDPMIRRQIENYLQKVLV